MAITIVEVLYPDVTQLDFTGPHTVFARIPEAEVIVASALGGEITSDDGLRFAATMTVASSAMATRSPVAASPPASTSR